MRISKVIRRFLCLFTVVLLTVSSLSGCGDSSKGKSPAASEETEDKALDTSRFLVAVEDEPDTVDFQCTSIHYTVAQNVFNRLVEMTSDEEGNAEIQPSLARSVDMSDDGRSYTFHLREGVTFSNGSPLTSSDVLYTFTRLLTHPDSCNRDIAEEIAGADRLEQGETDELEGFRIINDTDFVITLAQPFEAFLACLSMPGASILDQETTEAAGDRFGKEPDYTIGTGPFILREWNPGEGMLLTANPDCFDGAPACEGLDLRFMTEAEAERSMFENGELDILDLDEMGDLAEYFIHGDIYQDRLHQVQPIGLNYIALNESIEPLNDVKVRKALQLGLNRNALLDAVYSGRGSLENGIFSHGLKGFNPELDEIPYDPEQAKELLKEAGYPQGFDLVISVKSSSTQWELILVNNAVAMWKKLGINASVKVISEDEFMSLRKSGQLACYTATWTADYSDPDNFIYTFFGNPENTRFRSLCYPNEKIMDRVTKARGITDDSKRIKEYQELEKIIVQEDAAWIPLFSRIRYYVTGENIEGFKAAWNGSVKANYRYMSRKDPD